jgi:hypothetical protein
VSLCRCVARRVNDSRPTRASPRTFAYPGPTRLPCPIDASNAPSE